MSLAVWCAVLTAGMSYMATVLYTRKSTAAAGPTPGPTSTLVPGRTPEGGDEGGVSADVWGAPITFAAHCSFKVVQHTIQTLIPLCFAEGTVL